MVNIFELHPPHSSGITSYTAEKNLNSQMIVLGVLMVQHTTLYLI